MNAEADILTGYIRKETGFDGVIGLDVDLLRSQVLDSFSIVTLAVFIQEEFGIELEPEDLVRENLARISSMVNLIRRKRGTPVSGT
jgi:acyl carrier protein